MNIQFVFDIEEERKRQIIEVCPKEEQKNNKLPLPYLLFLPMLGKNSTFFFI